MRIIGIDPGYAITGYSVLDYQNDRFHILDYGLISTEAGQPFPDRLLKIDHGVTAICQKFRPEVMAIEELFFSSNTTTAMGVAQARGVAIVAAARQNVTVYEYTPMQVKLAITGYGKAEKVQVQDMVRRILKLPAIPKPDDVADAIAIAVCHAHSGNRPDALAVSGYQ